DKGLFELKQHFFKIRRGFDLELKGRLLLNERKIILPKNREFIRQLIALLQESEVAVLAVIQDGVQSMNARTYGLDHLPNLYRQILRRVNSYVADKHPGKIASLVFDAIDDSTNHWIARQIYNYFYLHRWGQGSNNLLFHPFFADSKISAGLELADILSYCVNERYTGRRGHIETFFQEFRDLAYNHEAEPGKMVWGIEMIQSDHPE
ncbi:MAG: DUF3800 domain-containing protein, partial [Desulfomonilaceae bacterium]|nr:DUF3800 domain-containing protein [Desulfomonilaceae bacterium]